MNYRDKPELREQLAGEYVLGTLRGAARARFKGWMIADAALRRTVNEWQSRLAPMAAAIAPVTPPRRVWAAIAARIAAPGFTSTRRGLWENLPLWRAVGLGASGMAVAMLAAVVLVAPEPPQPAPAPQIIRVPASVVPPSYVAVLADPNTHKPVLMVAAARKSDQLLVKRLDDSIMVADKSLELWALPAGQAPISLGVVAPESKYLQKLAAVADQSLGEIPQIALSLEPKGGSPSGAPSGPVLYSGPCIKYW